MYNPIITETFKRNTKYPWYENFREERMSYVDEDKNITIHDDCVNMSQEDNSQYIPFIMDRYYQGIDLMSNDMLLQIHFVNSKLGSNDSTPINVEYSENTICFGWLVDRNATFVDGELTFEIRAIGSIKDSNGNKVDYVWKTRPNKQIKIEKSLSNDTTFAPTQDWYVELIQVINQTSESTNNAKDDAENARDSALEHANLALSYANNANTYMGSTKGFRDETEGFKNNADTFAGNAQASADASEQSAQASAASATASAASAQEAKDTLSSLNSKIDSEITRSTTAENGLSARIDSVSSKVDSEITRSTSADSSLDSRINDTNNRITETNTTLSNETLRAQGKENELSAKADKNTTDIASIKEDIVEINGDITVINSALATKANATDVANAMELKLDTVDFNSAISTKADATIVSTLSNTVNALGTTVADKANVSDLELKADKTYVEEKLSEINTTINAKADKTYMDESFESVNSTLANKADIATVSTLSGAVDSLSVTVENKADVSHIHAYIHIGVDEPIDTEAVLWIDTVNGLKYYDGSAWVNVPMASNT